MSTMPTDPTYIFDGISEYDVAPLSEFDAIVVGSGLTGSLAAYELTSHGLNVLLVERGGLESGATSSSIEVLQEAEKDYAIQRKCGLFSENTKRYFVSDSAHPYEVGQGQFSWIRGYHLGGRSLTWSGHCYRLGPEDFTAVHPDFDEPSWPISYDELAPWYDRVDSLLKLTGRKEGWLEIPDSIFASSPSPHPADAAILNLIAAKRPLKKKATMARMAVGMSRKITANYGFAHRPMREDLYTSLNGALPGALHTGKLKILVNVICHSMVVSEDGRSALGVRVIDGVTKESREVRGKLVFLCASTIPSTQILLNSWSARHPHGLGNNCDLLGRYLMDHIFQSGAEGEYRVTFEDAGEDVANGIYIPRSTSVWKGRGEFAGGYGFQGATSTTNCFHDRQSRKFWLGGWGEAKPMRLNRIQLSEDRIDAWGMPLVTISYRWSQEDLKLREKLSLSACDILEILGCRNIKMFNLNLEPGLCIHEMGTARMGKSPENSVLNANNQLHDCGNVFVTDGSCMPASPCQNPSITYMALTSRACAYAVQCLKRGLL